MNRARAQAEIEELRARDDAVLEFREPRDRSVNSTRIDATIALRA